MFHHLPNSAWADWNLAEVAVQLGNMVEPPNQSQPNPSLRAECRIIGDSLNAENFGYSDTCYSNYLFSTYALPPRSENVTEHRNMTQERETGTPAMQPRQPCNHASHATGAQSVCPARGLGRESSWKTKLELLT